MRTAKLLWLVVVAVLLFMSVPVGAQQPVAPPPPQIPYGAPISLEQAKKVLAGAEAEATKNKWNMVIAVLDSGGHLVMLEHGRHAAGQHGSRQGQGVLCGALPPSHQGVSRPRRAGWRQPSASATERRQPARGRHSGHRRRQADRRGRRIR